MRTDYKSQFSGHVSLVDQEESQSCNIYLPSVIRTNPFTDLHVIIFVIVHCVTSRVGRFRVEVGVRIRIRSTATLALVWGEIYIDILIFWAKFGSSNYEVVLQIVCIRMMS